MLIKVIGLVKQEYKGLIDIAKQGGSEGCFSWTCALRSDG